MTDTRTDPVETAHEAAELVRRLNHETLNADRMSAPEISRAARHLLDLMDRLPQAFEQLADHLDRQQTAGRIRMEDGSDSAQPVAVVKMRLEQAASLVEPPNRKRYGAPAGPANEALRAASERLFRMGGVLDPED